MGRYAVLLRGVNVGKHRRLAMADLRAMLEKHGYQGVRTHGQSGNVVLETASSAQALERELAELLGTAVVVRTAKELGAVVERDPLAKAADNGSRHLVTFLDRRPSAQFVRELTASAEGDEEVVAYGREIYSWHPSGQHESRLAKRLAAPTAGVATARNWNTVTKVLALVQAD